MATLGIDIGGVGDIDPMMNFSSPERAVAESCIASLTHDPGVLWWAPERGHNINRYLHVPTEPDEAERGIQAECEADERVKSAEVTVTFADKTITCDVKLFLENRQGSVQFTLTVSEAGDVINASIS